MQDNVPPYLNMTFPMTQSSSTSSVPSYWANYGGMFDILNKDRQQTLQAQSTPGFSEMNPVLGTHPDRDKINAFFAADMAIPYLAKSLPDWAKSSLADTIAFNEQMLTDQNARKQRGENLPNSFPIGAKFTYNGDWDQALSKWAERLRGK